MAPVLVQRQEEPQPRGVRDLVVKGLPAQTQEGGVGADVAAASGLRRCSSRKMHTGSPVAWIASALDSTFWARPPRGPRRPPGCGHVEAHLHEGGLCAAVLVELQGHLVLARGTLGHVAERDLEDRLVASVEGKQLPTKLHGSPVPTLHTQILLH